MATSLLLMSSSDPTSNTTQVPQPDPNPNPPRPHRGRKTGSKSQNGSKKQPQRGMGVAQLERLLRQQNPNQTHHNHDHPCFNYDGVAHYGFPVLRGSGQCEVSRPGVRVLEGPTPTHHDHLELPSMPNIHHSAASLSYKKKKMIGDEVAVGFMRSDKEKIFSGYNLSGFNHHNYNYASGSEVVAIHKKGNGSGNVMMEYGFFPEISDENDEIRSKMMMMNKSNPNNYSYYEMGDLRLKIGLISDSSSPHSHSPSSSYSSLSSLTTATNSTTTATRSTAPPPNTCSNSDLDLSLKLSY